MKRVNEETRHFRVSILVMIQIILSLLKAYNYSNNPTVEIISFNRIYKILSLRLIHVDKSRNIDLQNVNLITERVNEEMRHFR